MMKAMMVRLALERYLLHKTLLQLPTVQSISVRLLAARLDGCNWDIRFIDGIRSRAEFTFLMEDVVAPMKAVIDLIGEPQPAPHLSGA